MTIIMTVIVLQCSGAVGPPNSGRSGPSSVARCTRHERMTLLAGLRHCFAVRLAVLAACCSGAATRRVAPATDEIAAGGTHRAGVGQRSTGVIV